MTELELKEKLINLRNELNSIIEKGETEKRELVEDETSRMAEIRTEMEQVEAEIKNLEEENRKIAENNNTKTAKKNMEQVRLFDLIKEVAEGSVKDEHRAYVQGNSINFRNAIQATATGYGEEVVPEEKKGLEVAIRNASVLNKLGVTWFGNAVGNVSVPKYSGSHVGWSTAENSQAEDGAGTFSEVVLSPKRLTAYITISRQFLAQSADEAEAILRRDLGEAISMKLDQTLFGAGSGSTTEPAGLFSGDYIMTGTSLDSVVFSDVLSTEEAVELKNGQDFVFVCDPRTKYALRNTQMANALNFVWDKGEIDGRQAVVSNSVNAKSLLCLEPKDVVVATWDNDMTLIVDPYSLADRNQIKITCNYLVDAALKGDRISGQIFS